MYLGKSVSIVFPVFNEAGNVKRAIEAFLAHPAVDELVAVDNNSTDGSDLEIKKTAARYVNEPVQGYGAAMQRGMGEAAGDIIVTVEPDGTFRSRARRPDPLDGRAGADRDRLTVRSGALQRPDDPNRPVQQRVYLPRSRTRRGGVGSAPGV